MEAMKERNIWYYSDKWEEKPNHCRRMKKFLSKAKSIKIVLQRSLREEYRSQKINHSTEMKFQFMKIPLSNFLELIMLVHFIPILS